MRLQGTPAMVLAQGRARVHRSTTMLLVLGLVWGVGAGVWLLVELGHGPTAVATYWDLGFPFWWLLAASVPLAAIVLETAYGPWLATGRRHGFLDVAHASGGLLLVHRRPFARRQTVLVQPGQTLEITAIPRTQRLDGLSYRFVVSAPGGWFSFFEDVRIDDVSLAPLDEAARALRIEVVTGGAAEQMGRGHRESAAGA